jgi:hypothetical protein
MALRLNMPCMTEVNFHLYRDTRANMQRLQLHRASNKIHVCCFNLTPYGPLRGTWSDFLDFQVRVLFCGHE